SFINASTHDNEIHKEHAIDDVLWRQTARRRIKYIISGINFATESINVPDWSYGHSDWRYIKDVQRRFGTMELKNFPHFTLSYLLLYLNAIRRVRTISILNYVDYHKQQAMDVL